MKKFTSHSFQSVRSVFLVFVFISQIALSGEIEDLVIKAEQGDAKAAEHGYTVAQVGAVSKLPNSSWGAINDLATDNYYSVRESDYIDDFLAEVLYRLYQSESPADYDLDTLSWIANALGTPNDGRYIKLLDEVRNSKAPSKLKKYANRAYKNAKKAAKNQEEDSINYYKSGDLKYNDKIVFIAESGQNCTKIKDIRFYSTGSYGAEALELKHKLAANFFGANAIVITDRTSEAYFSPNLIRNSVQTQYKRSMSADYYRCDDVDALTNPKKITTEQKENADSIEGKLIMLKRLFDDGLINEADYLEKKKEILDDL